MSTLYLKSGAAGFALLAALFITPPASAQLGGVTGQVGGAVDATTRTTTDLQSRTRLEKDVELPETDTETELENETRLSNQSEADIDSTLDGEIVRDDMLDTMAEGQARVDATGDAAVNSMTETSARTMNSAQTQTEAQIDAATETSVETSEAVQSQAETTGTVSGEAETDTRIGVNAPSNVAVGVSSPVTVGLQSSPSETRYSGQSEVRADATAPSTSLDGMLTVGTRVMSTSGATLGTITGLETTDAGVISAVTLDGEATAVPVSALSAQGDVLVSSMTEANVK